MTVAQLIERLSKLDPGLEVMILDGFNGGGCPRELNLGPMIQQIESSDVEDSVDCEERLGESIVVIGYGCY